jgi:hypothetical protein
LLAHCHLYCIANMMQRSSIRNRSTPPLTGSSCGDFFRVRFFDFAMKELTI